MPGYSSSNAPAISLEGPSTRMGTEHYKATQFQSHNNYGGTYGDERKVAYISLRKAGKTKEEAFQAINYADKYFVGEWGGISLLLQVFRKIGDEKYAWISNTNTY